MRNPQQSPGKMSSVPSQITHSDLSSVSSRGRWATEDFIRAHELVKESGKHNFEGCRLPLPTAIRYDRLEEALGDEISPRECRMLSLLRYGMPIGRSPGYGVRKVQKNHFSAVSFKSEVNEYFEKGVQSQQLLGPFEQYPVSDLCFSPVMSVPKDNSKCRVVVDFSFPPGKSINDGISTNMYLDFAIEFSLPSVRSMIDRLNVLGTGCLMFKRDLKGAFRQFWIDPGD